MPGVLAILDLIEFSSEFLRDLSEIMAQNGKGSLYNSEARTWTTLPYHLTGRVAANQCPCRA